MSTAQDNLETLLSEIHRTISDNKRFLQTLIDDADSGGHGGSDDETNTGEDFEVL